MQEPTDPSLPIVIALVSGLFALLGGFVGAWLARRTEYEKWLRAERSTAFAAFLKQLHEARQQALEVAKPSSWTEERRDRTTRGIFAGLNAQENVVRLYLKAADGTRFSDLKKELAALHCESGDAAHRVKRGEEILSEVQSIFESTLHG